MSIIYRFPIKEFTAAEGGLWFTVTNHELKLDREPEPALGRLIEKFGGERAEPEPEPASKPPKPARKSRQKAGGR